jgi:hypothetical protein
MPENNYKTKIKEQCSDSAPAEIEVNILCENGQIWIRPDGYGEKCTIDGQGYPVGIEIWQGKLRLIVFNDIKSEEPQIIDLEKAKESCRDEYCKAAEYLAEQGRRVYLGPMEGGIWNGVCLTACIISHKQNEKGAYEYLLKIADKYSVCLTNDQKQILQEIKVKAAAFLESVRPSSSDKDGHAADSMDHIDDNSNQKSLTIDLEKSSETTLTKCNWCGKMIETESIKWKGLLFCSDQCLDACRAVQ